jgi:hypothetical protein
MAVSEQLPKLRGAQKIEFLLAAPPCSRPLAALLSSPRMLMIVIDTIATITGRLWWRWC